MDKTLAPYGITVLRIALGSMWISHALLKYFVFTLDGFAGFMGSLGMPAFLATPIFFAELLGGIAIVLGVYSRHISLALLPVLLGAAYVHMGNGWVFSNANGGWEYPVFLIAASIAHILLGDGIAKIKSLPLIPVK